MAARRRTGARRWWSLPEIDWGRAGRGMAVAGWVVAAAGAAAACVLGVPRLEAYASAGGPGADEIEVRFADAPEWVEPGLREALEATAAAQITPDPLRRTDLVDARESLLATGWFSDVRQVRRVDAGHVEVSATFARPAAVIRDAAGRHDYLVDAGGHLLPKVFDPGDAAGYAVITGAQYNRPARPGAMWPGDDVTAALQVLQLVQDRPWRGQVAAIDVTRHWRDRSIRLVTGGGCTILWGRAPGEEGGAEVPAAQKLSYLDYHDQQYGRIDRGLTELDITGDVVTGR